MEGFVLCLGILFVFSFPEVSHSQLYTLITPNVLRVESEEKIVVEAHGLTTPSEVTITIYDFPQKRRNLYHVKTSLNSENGMMGTAVIKVPAKDMKVNSKQNQYVFVEAKFPQQTLEKIVLVSFHSGYIFIQTDKTIYTPGSSVLFRIFSIGHKLEPLRKNLITQVETPEGRVVRQNIISFFMPGVATQSFSLPEINNLGTWKMVAWYDDTPQKNFSAQFEVKEYVLPSFAVTLEPSEKFVCINDNKDLKVSINARALNGKELYGTAFVLFGVKVDNRKKSIPQSLKRVLIIDGAGEAVLTKTMLRAQFPSLSELIGHSIYISVTVLTDSGTETVEETNINIVASPPYDIHFTNTPKYFKPGVPFDLMVSVTNPDGSPAAQVPLTVKVRGLQDATLIHTLADGTAKWNVNPAADVTQLPISVKTALANLPENQQVSKSMVAEAYQTQEGSKNYLHLLVSATQVKPRDKLLVSFHLKTSSADGLNQIQYISYLILNKGTIIHAGRLARQVGKTVVTMSLSITPNLMPSFRIVGYYHIRQKEIVADSVWVDVQGTCMGTLVIKEATNVGIRNSEPGRIMKIKIKGDATAPIALVAVDKAVSLLNKKHMITQTKIWDAVENSDIGCTAGSGKNILGVFADAGLALVTNVKISTPTRTDPQCPQPAVLRHRSVQLSKTKQVAWYQNEQLRRCCEDGTYENPMGHSCEKRAQNIQEKECKMIFLTCCQMAQKKHQKHHLETSSDFIDDDDFLPNDEIATRSIFPERWLWQVELMTKLPNQEGNFSKTMPLFLKDSITTWQVLAVSVSETTGICVADPYEITILIKFAIDLRLPYSVVRNEPVEIQAIFYNNLERDIKVRMELVYNPAFCSPSSSKANYRQIFNLKARSSQALPFVIVPLQLGFHNLEIIAAVWNSNEADHVKKKLKVVPEGRKETKTIASILLDPARKGINGVQEVMVGAADIDDMVPNTESQTRIIFQGKPVVHLTEEPFDGTRLNQFILKPHGNGEVNMKNMSATVIATHYLDHTEQWEKIGMDLRVEARNLILQGYMQQLAFKKPDHSYAAFRDQPSSTWLTAYVTKVFAMASHLVPIPYEVICNAGHWLFLEKHNPDGTFKEDSPVIQKAMVGGYQGAEPEVSLTAFVLIAMLESKDICQNLFVSFHKNILVAGEYLSTRYSSLTRPYTVAITSYALALMGKLPDAKKLMAASKDGNRWEEQDHSNFNTESTSYALLALLRLKRFDLVGPVVRWLKQQAYYVESYDSIATVVMFQALGQYHIDVPLHEDLMLDVSFLLPRRAKKLRYRIAYTNAHLTRNVETKFNDNFTITAEGYGQVTLTVVTDYNARIQEDESQCETFDLSVSVQEAQGAKKADGTLRSVSFEICTRFLGAVNATMSVLHVSMLKGFLPDTEDLIRLSQGVDRYVSWYEIDTTLSDQVNLIIYLDTVSHVKSCCLRFKAHQFFEVGLIKPLPVTVYEYYATDARCTKFYQLPKQSSVLSSFSHEDVHQCGEENCSKQGQLNGSVTQEMRLQEACKPEVDYVYKARLIKTEESSSYDKYTMEILEAVKAGTDENPEGKTRVFVSHANCRQVLKQELNNDYLIWGLKSDLWASGANIFYVIGKDTWMEKLPSESKCQQADFKNLCIEFVEFSQTIMVFGCPA